MGEGEDFRDIIDRANEAAKKKADKEVQDKLDAITAQANQLRGIFDSLKLTDAATYDELIRIVNEAKARNESTAAVVDRLEALGEAGKELAGTVAQVAGAGPLTPLLKALALG